TYGQPQLGYITDPEDASTFVAVGDALDQTSSYTQVENFIVPTNIADGAFFAIRYSGGLDNTGYAYIDDITVTKKPTCNKPTGVAVTADSETAEGATITWNANGMSAWKMQVSEGDAASWGSDIAAASNSKVLTGLNANTLYYVRVKADCGGAGDSEWSDAVSFTTLCGTINVSASSSWNIDFEGLSDHVIPECWDNSASTTTSSWGSGYIWGTYSRFSNTMLAMDNAALNGGTALINTPDIAIPNDGREYELTFDYSNMALAGNNLIVKISANGGAFADKGTFYPSGNVSSYPGAFSNAVISLADYSGKTIKVQFFANPTSGTSSEGGAMFVDNVSVHKVSSCAVPTALAAGNLTANSAHITWTAGGSESAWRLQYRADGGDWSAEQAVSGSAQRDLTGLSANTEYFVRVKAYCDADDQSNWSDVLSFTTLCAAASMPFSEEFSSASELPSCWEATTTSVNGWSAYEKSGAYSVQLRTGSSGQATLRLPAITLSEDAILRFEWKNVNSTQVNLYISTDGGSSRTLLPNDLSCVHADWTTKIFDLSAYTGETVLIYFVSNFTTVNQYAYLDDVEVVARPCDMILNIQAAPITGGATISWSGNVKKLQYKLATADSWTSETIAAANYAGPKSISGLIPARTYQVRLLPACSEEAEGNWTTPVSFTTTAMESVPYSNDFESETPGQVPFNWSRISASEYPQVSHDAYAYKEGESFGYQGNSIKFYGVNTQTIVFPEFNADLKDLVVSFHYRNRDCTMQLGYVEDDGTTFVALENLPTQSGYGEFPFEKDLYGISSDAKNIAIRYTNAGSQAQCWVDNVEVKEATCGQPTNLAFDNLTANSVHITWAASDRGTESNYQYIRRIWDEDDPNWASATLVGNDVLELDLTGLTPNTEYEFYLRSFCGVSDQSTPVKIEFKTLMKDEVFADLATATDNESRLAALNGQTINMIIERPLLRNGDYCTLCLPFNLTASQIADANCPLHGFVIKEFEHSENKEGEVNLYLRQVSSIEAGKPYFVRYAGAPTDDRLTPLRFEGVKILLSTPVAVSNEDCTPHGVFNPYALTGGDNTTFFLSSANTLYYPSANGTMNGFRAYVHIDPESPLGIAIRRGAPMRIRESEQTATGIDEVPSDKVQRTKVLRNGQIIIIRDGKEYNVMGIRL
ncbi:MAG: fibronectin type III domain-containing protein, partial [Paludibacteraceae bacterium]|nr:fibronectin type III domain-containing protein [Paludibacteraceae bacterium]